MQLRHQRQPRRRMAGTAIVIDTCRMLLPTGCIMARRLGIMLMMPDMPRLAARFMLTIRRRRRPAELDRQQHQQKDGKQAAHGADRSSDRGGRASRLTAGANYRTCPASPVPIASQPGLHTNAGAACKPVAIGSPVA